MAGFIAIVVFIIVGTLFGAGPWGGNHSNSFTMSMMIFFASVFGAIAAYSGVNGIRAESERRREERRRQESEERMRQEWAKKAESDRQQAENARREAENVRREQHRLQQRHYHTEILKACEYSVGAFEDIPKNLMTAEQLLDVADNEFQDGAFSPFWDSIEQAMDKLDVVDRDIKVIGTFSDRYKQLAIAYEGRPPPFPVDPAAAARLGTANETASRLQKIVRQAQRDFQFATIYEQRKNSHILIAGFANLGQAIQGLGERLQVSIGGLGDQIHNLSSSMTAMNKRLVAAVEEVSSSLTDVWSAVGDVSSAVTDADKNMQAAMADQATRQERALAMLDNIQRHRVPP